MKSKYARWGFSHLLAVVMIVAAGSAFAAGETLMHNSNNLGTKYGVWGVAGGKYGQFTCTTCHNATTNNVMRVAGTITAPLGNWSSSKTASVSVVFNNMTAFGNDFAGRTTSTRICEVCHSKTSVHKYDTTGQTDLNHQGANLTDCTACHSHASAFKAEGCTGCHGDATSGTLAGQHTAHVNNSATLGVNYGCADCHAKTVTDNTTIKSSPTSHRNGVYGDFSGARAYRTGYVQGSGNCTTYCHTNGKGGVAAVTVNWTAGPAINDCKGCHGGGSNAGEPFYPNGGINSVTANTHPTHVVKTGLAASCQNCHGATMNGTVLNASGKHTDKTIDVLQGNSKTFTYSNDSSKTCSTVSCHSNGFFTPAAAQWGDTLDCVGCHTSSALSALGKHTKHLSPTIASAFNCGNCHADTATNSTTLKAGTTVHMDAAPNVKFDANNVNGTFAGGNCSNLYCHSYGTTTAGPFKVKTVPSWSGAAVNCYSCHGSDSTTGLYNNMSTGRHKKHMVGQYSYGCAVCHAATVSNNTTISDVTKHVNVQIDVTFSGVAKTGNAAATYALNGHAPGATGTVNDSCSNVYCHSNAQTGGQAGTTHYFRNLTGSKRFNQTTTVSLGCNGCHSTGSTTTGKWTLSGAHLAHLSLTVNPQIGKVLACNDCHANGGTNLNKANHANGLINYSSALGGSIARNNLKLSTGRCNTVYCHSNGQGVFNSMSTNNWFSGVNLGCNGCHADAAGATSLSGKHNAHINGGTTGGSFGCVDCHASTVSNNTTVNALGNHVNAMKNFSGAKAYKTGFVAGAGTCATYCHTDGKGNAVAPPLWTATGGSSTLDCNGCHAQAGLIPDHAIHLARTDIGCANCHSATTTNGTSITGTVHIDGTVELQAFGNYPVSPAKAVSFDYAGAGTCNNISCHSPASVGPYVNSAKFGVKPNCAGCHPTLSGKHSVHMGALDLTNSAVLYNMTANRTPAQNDTVKTHGFGCANCHPMNAANHLNGSIDVDMSAKGQNGLSHLRFLNSTTATNLPSYVGGKCNNIYCHSNASRVASENVYKQSPTWVGGTFTGDRCAGCHDNQPATGAHAAHAVGNHTDNIYNGKSGKVATSNRANTAHGNPNNSTTIGCYICHNATVTSKANDNNTKCAVCHFSGNTVGALLKGAASIANLQNHVNGSREIQFLPIQVKSKAQIRPESFKFYSGVWQRSSYKNMSTLSYDVAKNALDTATMWHPSTPMASNCTNIACHNGKTVSWNLANWNDPNKCMDCHNQL